MKFDEVRTATWGRTGVRRGKRWGYTDARGRVVIELKYDWVTCFDGGAALVCLAGREKFIDSDGHEISESVAARQGLRRLPWKGIPSHRRRGISDQEYMRISPYSASSRYLGHKRNPNEHTGGPPWGH